MPGVHYNSGHVLGVSERHSSKSDTVIAQWNQIRIVVIVAIKLVDSVVGLFDVDLPMQADVKIFAAEVIDEVFLHALELEIGLTVEVLRFYIEHAFGFSRA